jgi:hypothetical protein
MFKKLILKLSFILRKRPFTDLIILICFFCLRSYRKYDEDITKNVLVLNHERFRQDLNVLAMTEKIKFLILPSRLQTFINTLFLGQEMRYEVESYVNLNSKTEPLILFIEKLLKSINNKFEICAILTCSFYYRQDFPYQFSCINIQIPFYVLFKEYMKDTAQIKSSINNYQANGYKFYGEKIFTANKNIEELLIKSNVCKQNKLKLVGSPRFDAIITQKSQTHNEPKPIVTLFSFYHGSGLVKINGRSNFFSDDKSTGFVELFDEVHSAIAQLALLESDYHFNIKTKWAGEWHEKIISSIMSSMGIDIRKIPNISLLDESEDAQNLIGDSSVIVAFNSTTVIEASLMKKTVVIPIFAEAKDKYLKTNVLFTDFFDDLIVASSKAELMNMIIKYSKNNHKKTIPDAMTKKFIGYNDGKASQRIIHEFLQ